MLKVFRAKLSSILSDFTKVNDRLQAFIDESQNDLDKLEQERFVLTDEISRASRVRARLMDLLG
jgi:hypothetical protein